MPAGRPSTYNAVLHPKLIKALAAQGYTDEQIAQEIGISSAGLYKWYKAHPELVETKKLAGRNPDQEVVDSLFKRAKGGYTLKEVTRNADGEIIKTVEKEVGPDAVAGIYWTKNRMRDRWRDQWPEPPARNDTSPLQITFPDTPDLIDPEKQDNLEISNGE